MWPVNFCRYAALGILLVSSCVGSTGEIGGSFESSNCRTISQAGHDDLWVLPELEPVCLDAAVILTVGMSAVREISDEGFAVPAAKTLREDRGFIEFRINSEVPYQRCDYFVRKDQSLPQPIIDFLENPPSGVDDRIALIRKLSPELRRIGAIECEILGY